MSGVLLIPYYPIAHTNHEAHLPEVLAALKPAAKFYRWSVQTEELTAEHDAYYRLLCEMWDACVFAHVDLCVIEQDVIVHQGVLEAFHDCQAGLCAYSYWIGASYAYGLGCTRFRYRFLRDYREALSVAGTITDDGIPQEGHWLRLDTRLYRALALVGAVPCRHEPPVCHLHAYAMPEPDEDTQSAIADFRASRLASQ